MHPLSVPVQGITHVTLLMSVDSWSYTLNPACGIVAHLRMISFHVSMRDLFPQDVCSPAHLISLNGPTAAELTLQGGGQRLPRRPGRCKLMVYLFCFSFCVCVNHYSLERMIRLLKPIFLRFVFC